MAAPMDTRMGLAPAYFTPHPPQQSNWSYSCCGCCADGAYTCCCGMFCPCCVFGAMAKMLETNTPEPQCNGPRCCNKYCCIFCVLYHIVPQLVGSAADIVLPGFGGLAACILPFYACYTMHYRESLRLKYNLPVDPSWCRYDCVAWWCCPLCMACQEYNEMYNRLHHNQTGNAGVVSYVTAPPVQYMGPPPMQYAPQPMYAPQPIQYAPQGVQYVQGPQYSYGVPPPPGPQYVGKY